MIIIYVKIHLVVLGQRDASVLRRFEAFCAAEGFGPSDPALRDVRVIEAFLAIGCSGLAPHSLGTYRATLVRLGGAPRGTREFSASSAPAPYDDAQIAALWSMARHQSRASRVTDATVLLGATLGAGLRPGELARLASGDVTRQRARVVVTLRGRDARTVPVLAPYGDDLAAVARERPGYLFRPGAVVRTTKNLVGEVADRLVRDPDEVALSSARARSTFICAHLAAGTALGEICDLAGLHDVESLLRYARHVPGAATSKAGLRAQLHHERHPR